MMLLSDIYLYCHYGAANFNSYNSTVIQPESEVIMNNNRKSYIASQLKCHHHCAAVMTASA